MQWNTKHERKNQNEKKPFTSSRTSKKKLTTKKETKLLIAKSSRHWTREEPKKFDLDNLSVVSKLKRIVYRCNVPTDTN